MVYNSSSINTQQQQQQQQRYSSSGSSRCGGAGGGGGEGGWQAAVHAMGCGIHSVHCCCRIVTRCIGQPWQLVMRRHAVMRMDGRCMMYARDDGVLTLQQQDAVLWTLRSRNCHVGVTSALHLSALGESMAISHTLAWVTDQRHKHRQFVRPAS